MSDTEPTPPHVYAAREAIQAGVGPEGIAQVAWSAARRIGCANLNLLLILGEPRGIFGWQAPDLATSLAIATAICRLIEYARIEPSEHRAIARAVLDPEGAWAGWLSDGQIPLVARPDSSWRDR